MRCFRGNFVHIIYFPRTGVFVFFFKEQPSFRILSRCTDVKARHVLYG